MMAARIFQNFGNQKSQKLIWNHRCTIVDGLNHILQSCKDSLFISNILVSNINDCIILSKLLSVPFFRLLKVYRLNLGSRMSEALYTMAMYRKGT